MDMDLSSMWLEELEIFQDQEFINKQHYHDKSKSSSAAAADSLSPESYTNTEYFSANGWLSTPTDPTTYEDQQIEIMKPPASSKTPNKTTSTNFTISFGDLNDPKDDETHTIFDHDSSLSGHHETSSAATVGKLFQAATASSRTSVQTQDHVLAERKRREKLNRHFISLSSLLPNLKKMDKATVLEDATIYIKQLHERVKELEELSGVNRKDAEKCVIALKRSRLSGDDNDDSTLNDDSICKSSPAEIEVRMSGSCVLVRIYSNKSSSLLVKVLDKLMQNHGLSLISSSVMPFATTATLVVVVAQIESELSMTATDLVKSLRLAL